MTQEWIDVLGICLSTARASPVIILVKVLVSDVLPIHVLVVCPDPGSYKV